MKKLLFAFLAMGMLAACNNSPAGTDEKKEGTDTTAQKEVKDTVEQGPKGYAIGDAVEDFKLKNIDGKMLSMADFKDAKGFVLIFTCNHCPFSIAYEDRIIAFDKAYKKKGYSVIAINPNDPKMEAAVEDSYELMQKRAKEKGFSFPYLFDDGQNVFPKFAASKTPDCFIVQKTDAGLKLVYKGAFDDAKDDKKVTKKYIQDAVEALIAGKTPDPAETKAFGCGIKCEDKTKLKPKKD
jgi:peroxiredoxin